MVKHEPFNIDILTLSKKQISNLNKVTSLSIFEPSTKNFDPYGLFSTDIFGRVGSSERNYTFARIHLNIPVLHPLIFKHVSSLKKLYADIIAGIKYAKWDSKISDFVLSNANDGETGFNFFLSKFDKIKFVDNGSKVRLFKIKLIRKYKLDEILIKDFLVLPAGLRDYTIDENNAPSEDEVNAVYRRLLMTVNTLDTINTKSNLDMLDVIRYKIQLILVELYDHFISLMDGKKKFIQNKWTKRAIRDSTRNVITPMDSKIFDLTEKRNIVSYNNTVIGLYQYSKAINPITKHNLNTNILNHFFDIYSSSARLIDKKSLKTINAEVSDKSRDTWTSDEGLNGIINKLSQEALRIEPILIDDYYLAMIYDDNKKIKLVYNTNEIPEDIDTKHLRPITYVDLIYLAVYKEVPKYPGLLTRYPVTNLGSIYPNMPYLKTTVKGRKIDILNDMWEVEDTVFEYPKLDEVFVNSLSPNFSHLETLGAD